jgi:hypothetical protein
MKIFFTLLFIFSSLTVASCAQQGDSIESIYIIQYAVSIPTQSGIDLSAAIVRKETKTQTTIPLRVNVASVKTSKFN